jgi:hypothetical protein
MSKLVYGKFGPGRNAHKAPFSKREVAITLNGEEWFVLLSILSNTPPEGQFSDKGLRVLLNARKKLIAQISAQTESLS